MFTHVVRQFSEAQPEVMHDPQPMRLLLHALRADFTLVDSYGYADEPAMPGTRSGGSTAEVTSIGAPADGVHAGRGREGATVRPNLGVYRIQCR